MRGSTIAYGLVVILLTVALWNEEDRWKHACLIILLVAAITVLRIAAYTEGLQAGS